MQAENSGATREASRVALVTCGALNGLDPDDELLRTALLGRGTAVDVAAWDDPSVDWARYDLAVVRSTWDYATRRDEFLTWAAGVPRLANPARVLEWNTDKRYLAALADAGVPVVPTEWVAPGSSWTPGSAGEYVVKPTVGGGGVDAGRYDASRSELAAAHVRRLGAAGRHAMVQPYLSAVDAAGETALVWLGGRFSHAIRKGALLAGPDVGVDGLFRPEDIRPREPSAAERETAERVLAAMPFAVSDLLYARVDLIPGPDGEPLLLELELTEPSLFLGTASGAPDRLASAVTAHLS